MLIFGGDRGTGPISQPDYSRQISKIGNCDMKRIGDLPFDFENGGCTNLNGEFVLLCFPWGQRDSCYR